MNPLEGTSASFIPRNISPLVDELLGELPAVVIQGPRQVGKSTLTTDIVRRHGGVLYTLDDENILQAARLSPREFVSQTLSGVLAIDELQRAPELLTAIKSAIDTDRRPGRYILTGSADLLHVSGAQESLAGRVVTAKLWGLSQGERLGIFDDFVTWVTRCSPTTGRQFHQANYARIITEGGYPKVSRLTERVRDHWFAEYARAVIDHDAAEVSGLGSLDRLHQILRLLAAETSQEVVKRSISRGTGVPERSVPAYLRLLEDLYLIHQLPPWGRNLSKRVIEWPKAHITDSAFAAHLAGVSESMLSDILQRHKIGNFMETLVSMELEKQRGWTETPYKIFHYRDSQGPEVDLVIELNDGRIIGIEVKSASRLGNNDFKGLKYLRERKGHEFIQGVVFYTGDQELTWGDKLRALPISALWLHDFRIEFQSWMRQQKSNTGELFSERTIEGYVLALKNKTPELELPDSHLPRDLFTCTTLHHFRALADVIRSAPNFKEVNQSASNNSLKPALDRYQQFLEQWES